MSWTVGFLLTVGRHRVVTRTMAAGVQSSASAQQPGLSATGCFCRTSSTLTPPGLVHGGRSPDNAVRESRERVRAAIKNSGLDFPNRAYVVNLSPADLPKHSTSYDLAIAVGVVAATDQAPLETLEQALFIGEFSLDGTVRHVKGVMPMVYAALQAGFKTVYVPSVDVQQAAVIEGHPCHSS